MPDSQEPFDFIIVGAGSAGCALACRLTETGRYRVLLVEAGEDDQWIWLKVPTGIAKVMVGERALWRFHTEAEPGLGGRPLFWPRGRVTGGTATINGMFWVRGDPAEYDHWRALGNPGWGYSDVAPLFRGMEAYAGGDAAVRGRDGPLAITEYGPRDPLTDAFLRACAEAGFAENPDYSRGHYFGSYHPVGTCRMGRDAQAVVDAQMRVHGVPGLRVADASVFPTIPASNTNAAAILAGEKAAVSILADAASGAYD